MNTTTILIEILIKILLLAYLRLIYLDNIDSKNDNLK